jgi:hypothetical protein
MRPNSSNRADRRFCAGRERRRCAVNDAQIGWFGLNVFRLSPSASVGAP